jgi:hypothetical protein
LGGEWLMNPFDIFIAYVSWGSDGKRRPMLVYQINSGEIMAFPVTSQFTNKPKLIQAQYFVINDWSQAGLDKQSYVDTGTPYVFAETYLEDTATIGRLTESDKKRLIEFLLK